MKVLGDSISYLESSLSGRRQKVLECIQSVSVMGQYLGCQNSNSASSSKFQHLALLELLVALVLHQGDSPDLIFAIL